MDKKFLKKTLLLWVLFVPIAIINGTIRNFVYGPYVGELLAHQISTVVMIFLFLFTSYFMYKDLVDKVNYFSTFLMGTLLLVFTSLFEFGFGHYVMKHSWQKLIYDYNIIEGRIWSLVLVTVFSTPSIIKYLSK